MTRNQRYELTMKNRGLSKRTLWLPDRCECEIKQMVEFLIENPDFIPAMARDLKTGRLKKCID
ncbi:hypothetical protein BET10_01825 [Pseudoalteromonas amylolytica]|uniref:Uncharacterized protein n=1 Tax=Pseudoalteromonas amylolytica TaxID=1859457 RepID=A0A1S1N0T7_9GAMM|nr:hypothetical protein BET10_01825 [Pseudoalteromonas amylolytica]